MIDWPNSHKTAAAGEAATGVLTQPILRAASIARSSAAGPCTLHCSFSVSLSFMEIYVSAPSSNHRCSLQKDHELEQAGGSRSSQQSSVCRAETRSSWEANTLALLAGM